MKVEIREKKLKDNKVSLYLDIYNDGERTYQFLKLYLFKSPKNKEERSANSETMRKANAMLVKVENDLINNNDIAQGFKKSNILFLDYFKNVTEQKKKSAGNYGAWDSTYKILLKYYNGKKVKISDLKDNDLVLIKRYILNGYKTKSDVNLSQNAALAYFNKVKACLNQAFDERLINDKIGARAKAIKGEETRRQYLFEEEIELIEKTKCDSQILKNAFLFSIYTGLRWSDINNLTWDQIKFTANSGYSLHFNQQKTKGVEYLPIPNKALTFVGELQNNSERVFKGLKYSAWHNLKIREWMMNAGITRKITFHSARHTYATLLLTKKIDIYVVSNMLGHKNIKTTQVYAKVVDQRKIEAIKIFDEL